MSLSTNTTYRFYAEKLGGTDPLQFVGNEGEVFLNPSVPTLKLSDGSTPGGTEIGGSGGGSGGGIGSTANINTTGIITASSFVGSGTELTGIVTSVNTQTGAVSLGIEDLDDFALQPASGIPYDTWSTDNTPAAGEWHINSSFFYLPKVDANGVDQSSNFRALDGTTTLVITQGGTDFNLTNATIFGGSGGAGDELDGTNQRALITGGNLSTIDSSITKSGSISISCISFTLGSLPLANLDVLQYNSADSKFKPAQAAGVRSLLGIGEYADDTAAGTGGLSSGDLYYNTTSSSYVLKT